MESENILSINIPNIVSITIMAVVGGFVIGLIGKMLRQAQQPSGMAA